MVKMCSKHPGPSVDEAALKQDSIEIVVQVNGKLRGRVSVPAAAAEDRVREIALADEGRRAPRRLARR